MLPIPKENNIIIIIKLYITKLYSQAYNKKYAYLTNTPHPISIRRNKKPNYYNLNL